jgi:hypothetical protein
LTEVSSGIKKIGNDRGRGIAESDRGNERDEHGLGHDDNGKKGLSEREKANGYMKNIRAQAVN